MQIKSKTYYRGTPENDFEDGHWNEWIRDVLHVNLDPEQQEIVDSVQCCKDHRRTTVRSGHARGKDYVAAAISLAFLYLNSPSKVVSTAPTLRQVKSIMMTEIAGMWNNANEKLASLGIELEGRLLTQRLTLPEKGKISGSNHYLEGFKAADKSAEAWTGYHSENVLVVMSEASGITDDTFRAIEGLLTGNSRLLIVGNPVRITGGFYKSFFDPLYAKFTLNCLNAPNVLTGENNIPGQVDKTWIEERLLMPSWCTKIKEIDAKPDTEFDFCYKGQWYRPSDIMLGKVLGQFPRQSEDCLIPRTWVEAAFKRWSNWNEDDEKETNGSLRLGADIAGMGSDSSVYCHRYGDIVTEFEIPGRGLGNPHMKHAGELKNILGRDKTAIGFIDAIGEGAGVYARIEEQGITNCIPVKFSAHARHVSDETGQRQFLNVRAACYWKLRDALDPAFGATLCLPPDDELLEELCEMAYETNSSGKIQMEKKKDIKERIGRSPDKADALALTYFPDWDLDPRLGFMSRTDIGA